MNWMTCSRARRGPSRPLMRVIARSKSGKIEKRA